MQNPLDTLTDRGFVQDVTDPDGLRAALDAGAVTFYYGVDPTASSLHIGNLVGMMAMAWLQRSGHRPIALAGGGTGLIGDPSFRDDERELLTEAQIDANMSRIREQLVRVIDISTPERGLLLDNHDWLGELGFVEFIRDVGKHFSVNQMIARESVRRRLEEREHGISFTEFSYQLLQAYDFAHLNAAEGCLLQIGGSDQWGNITAGVELCRRLNGEQTFGLVWPLVERSDGKKFSKSTGGNLWLGADETSPYAFYQWFLNIPDDDVGRYLRLYTFLPVDEIDDLVDAGSEERARRIPQRRLAEEATRIVHGEEGLAAAQRASEVLFGDEPFVDLDEQTIADAFDSAPSIDVPEGRLGEIGLLELMVEVGAAASNGEARRLVTQGAVRISNSVVDDPATTIDRRHLIASATVILRTGKKNYYLARFG